jgi:hypothetical protein
MEGGERVNCLAEAIPLIVTNLCRVWNRAPDLGFPEVGFFE